jgi:hypothetical protein
VVEGFLMTERWEPGDDALHVALRNAATSFGRERIPFGEAVEVLSALSGGRAQVLADVALTKLRAFRGRGYVDQRDEMYAAATLLLAFEAVSRRTSAGLLQGT